MTDEQYPSRRSMRDAQNTDAQVPVSAQNEVPELFSGLTYSNPAPSSDSNAPGQTVAPTPPEPAGKRRWGGWVVAFVVLLLLGGATAAAWNPVASVIARFQGPADFQGSGTGTVDFIVNEGDTGTDIAEHLYEAGVTASVDAFYDLVVSQGITPNFVPGVFRLHEKMSAKAALDALLDDANRLQNTVLVTEGQTQADVFDELQSILGFSADELQALGKQPALFELPSEASSLEGFLFPATYQFDPATTAQQALQIMVDRCFEELDTAGVSDDERWSTIVLASLIQKEAGLRDDYYKVSRVFLNRMNTALWPTGLLESDATVAYGTGNTHRVSTTDAERADASNPFNTYVHPGMLVAPISNPGKLAIDAALNPADGPWLYFVTWNLDTGETIFSTTGDEHDAARAKWLDWMDDHPEYE